jgi:hypothetical protein
MEWDKPRRSGGGGAATQGGINYQNRVAAWVCTRILAESSAAPIEPVGIAAYARFETPEPVDDLLVGTVDNHQAFLQAKRTLTLSAAEDSDFASVVGQFVRQYLSTQSASTEPPLSRIPGVSTDRLVLATTSESSLPLRRELALALDRVRGLTPVQHLSDAASSRAQRKSLDVFTEHVRRCWRNASGANPSDAQIQAVCVLVHIAVLDVEADGTGEREARSLLETRVLARSEQAGLAWAIVADLSQKRSGIDKGGLRAALEEAAVPLKISPHFENDIATLKNYSKQTLRYLSRNSRITASGVEVRVERQVHRSAAICQ